MTACHNVDHNWNQAPLPPLDCVKAEEEFELCLPDGEVTVHGAVGASELINTAKSGTESAPANLDILHTVLWNFKYTVSSSIFTYTSYICNSN